MIQSNKLKNEIEAHIESLELERISPANLYRPMDYILSLKGKRIRPVLLMLAYHAVSNRKPTEAINLATSVELFHNFTLLHDDIMDRAPVRRGKPTAHLVWDENTVILSGDAMFAMSMGLIPKDFPAITAELIGMFSRVSVEVCEGQMEDMDMAGRQDVLIDEYIEMIRKKTAVLLGGSLSIGARAGGADESLVEKFREFGEMLGIGFQLQDDLMDAFPPEGFGKQVGGDIIENKKTFLLLKAYELSTRDQEIKLNRLIIRDDDPEIKVQGILELYRELNIEQETQTLIHQYFEKARMLSTELAELTIFEPISNYLEKIIARQV